MKSFRIIENPSELGAGTRGSSLGIEALRIAAINKKSKLFYDNEVVTLTKNNKKLFKNIDTPHAIRLKQVYNRIKVLGEEVANSLLERSFPLVISGDHSSAAGTIAGLKKAYPKNRIGVIWIDAHSDMHTPYTTPSGNVHGMPLAMAMGLDNKKMARNEVVDNTLDYWEKCKNLFDINPKMNPEDLVFIGLRSSEIEEVSLMDEYDVKKILVNEVREIGTNQTVKEALTYLSNCDSIYISLDVDSMDPDLTSYGTGTPVKGGLSPQEVTEIVANLLKDERIKVLELCEINPLLDNKNRMAEISLVILEDIIHIINKE
ncbi:MAG: arginase [Ignavibacteriae bacterium HGW-Ignavibacteriae-4]|jgi:arginase|nr:MAG: arginase [Ignavibacteriae bacterium HGW-Ignavibacteriae-4]